MGICHVTILVGMLKGLRVLLCVLLAMDSTFSGVSGAHITANVHQSMSMNQPKPVTIGEYLGQVDFWNNIPNSLSPHIREKFLNQNIPNLGQSVNWEHFLTSVNQSPSPWFLPFLFTTASHLAPTHASKISDTIQTLTNDGFLRGMVNPENSRTDQERLFWEVLRSVEDSYDDPHMAKILEWVQKNTTVSLPVVSLPHISNDLESLDHVIDSFAHNLVHSGNFTRESLEESVRQLIESYTNSNLNATRLLEHIRDSSHPLHQPLSGTTTPASPLARVLSLLPYMPKTASRILLLNDLEHVFAPNQENIDSPFVSLLEVGFAWRQTLSVTAHYIRIIMVVFAAGLILAAIVLNKNTLKRGSSEGIKKQLLSIVMLITASVSAVAAIIWVWFASLGTIQSVAAQDTLKTVATLIDQANEQRISNLFNAKSTENTNALLRDLENKPEDEEAQDPDAKDHPLTEEPSIGESKPVESVASAVESDPQYLAEKESFNHIFAEKLDGDGVKSKDLYSFLTTQGLSQSRAQEIVTLLDPLRKDHISFKTFYEKVLHPAGTGSFTSVLSDNFEEDREHAAVLLAGLLTIVLDGGSIAQTVLIITICGFAIAILTALAIARSSAKTSKASGASKVAREAGLYRSALKIVAAFSLIIVFAAYFQLSITCSASRPNCADGSPIQCVNSRPYLPDYLNCFASDVSCGNAGKPVWGPTYDAVTSVSELLDYQMVSFISSRDENAVKPTWDLVKAIRYAGKEQLISSPVICSALVDRQPCEVLAPSGSVVDIQDMGANTVEVVDGKVATRFVEKDVVFIPFSKDPNACASIDSTTPVQTVRSRDANIADFTSYFPSVGTDIADNDQARLAVLAKMMKIKTPSPASGSSDLFTMCQRLSTATSTEFKPVQTCAYRFNTAAACSGPDCSSTDFNSANSGSWVDRFYFTTIVHATIGFGDIVVTSLRTKSLTILETLLITVVATI